MTKLRESEGKPESSSIHFMCLTGFDPLGVQSTSSSTSTEKLVRRPRTIIPMAKSTTPIIVDFGFTADTCVILWMPFKMGARIQLMADVHFCENPTAFVVLSDDSSARRDRMLARTYDIANKFTYEEEHLHTDTTGIIREIFLGDGGMICDISFISIFLSNDGHYEAGGFVCVVSGL
jgi:hypothetical protein